MRCTAPTIWIMNGLKASSPKEKGLGYSPKPFFLLVGAGRFELPTPTTPLCQQPRSAHPEFSQIVVVDPS